MIFSLPGRVRADVSRVVEVQPPPSGGLPELHDAVNDMSLAILDILEQAGPAWSTPVRQTLSRLSPANTENLEALAAVLRAITDSLRALPSLKDGAAS